MAFANYPILPRSAIFIALEGGLDPAAWRVRKEQLNEDDFTRQMRDFRYFTTRMYKYYTESKYWRNLPMIDQCIAESIADYYADATMSAYAFEQAWALEQRDSIELEAKRFDNVTDGQLRDMLLNAHRRAQLESGMLNQREKSRTSRGTETWAEIEMAMPKYGNGRLLKGYDSYIGIRYDSWVAAPSINKEPAWLNADTAEGSFSDAHRVTRDIANKQQQISLQLVCMIMEYYAKAPFNELRGVIAKEKILLTDFNIPLPTYATILAFWQYFGIACRRLLPSEANAAYHQIGFIPEYIFTYCTPTMVRTKEHQTVGAVYTDDSHTDHSLVSKSKGHRRDDSGRIDYGFVRARTVLVNSTQTFVVAEEADQANLTSLSTHTLHEMHIRMMAGLRSTRALRDSELMATRSLDPFFGNVAPLNPDRIMGFAPSPYMANGESLPFFWPLNPKSKYSCDLGSRALAKGNGVYHRFDKIDALDEWCAAFEVSLQEFLFSTPSQWLDIMIECARRVDDFDMDAKAETITRGGNTMTFNADDF